GSRYDRSQGGDCARRAVLHCTERSFGFVRGMLRRLKVAAKIKHVAIVSHEISTLSRFYQTLFGMSSSGADRPGQTPAVVTDGYGGMNINGRANGRQGGFDHFGIEVDDVAKIEERVRELYP